MQQTTITSDEISQLIKVHILRPEKSGFVAQKRLPFLQNSILYFFVIQYEPFEVKRSMRLF